MKETTRWSPSRSKWKDFLHFCGPGWFVAIAYVDPGNYQADIQAGAQTGYSTIWTVWWTSIISIYVQVLCARLGVITQSTLAEAQASNCPTLLRYLNWFIAEFSVVITDLPEVIGIGIAFNVWFGWPYYVGVLISPVTTMLFLTMQGHGMRVLELVIVILVGAMSIAMWVAQTQVGTDAKEFMEGWAYGFIHTTNSDIFTITGIIGAVVMPHNLYLHTASVQSRPVERTKDTVAQAVWWTAVEPIVPILVSVFINTAIVTIAAESIYYKQSKDVQDNAGLTDFCDYITIKNGCVLWGIALLAAGQSSAITTTYSGQYIMDGFLDIRLPIWARAMGTRLIAIVPCVAVAVAADAQGLNAMINYVNAALSVLLPFALTPLVKFCTSKAFMGEHAAGPKESVVLWFGAFAVYAVNAYAMSAVGGGFFGDLIQGDAYDVTTWSGGNETTDAHNVTTWSGGNVTTQTINVQTSGSVQLGFVMDCVQIFFFAWNLYTALAPIREPMKPIEEPRKDLQSFGVVEIGTFLTKQTEQLEEGTDEAEHMQAPLLEKYDY